MTPRHAAQALVLLFACSAGLLAVGAWQAPPADACSAQPHASPRTPP